MIQFETILDALQRHLPRAADGSLVTFASDRLEVHEPGVSMGDLALMLQDLTGTDDMLPEGLPLAGLRLASLTLARGARGVELAFSVRWDGATLAVSSDLSLHFDRLDFELRRKVLRARAEARLDIEGHAFDAAFELPSRVFELVLEPTQLASATPLLAARGLVAVSGAPRVRHFAVRGSLWFQRVMLHVELENLFTFGPLTFASASANVVLAGEGSAAAVSATLEIALSGGHVLLVDADGEVDAGGWRIAGALDMQPGILTLGELLDAFTAPALSGHPAPVVPDAIRSCALTQLGVALDTRDGSIGIDAVLEWPTGATLAVRLDHEDGVLRVSGRLSFSEVVFELAFTRAGKTLLMGSYEAAGSKVMTLDAILGALSLDAAKELGPQGTGISLDVKGVAIVLDPKKLLLAAAQVDAGIDLTRLGHLPLVGSLLPHAEPLGLRIDPYFMASGFDPKQLAQLAPLPSSMALPDVPVAGAHVAASLHLGGNPLSLDLFKSTDSATHATSPTVAPTGAASPVAATGAMTWTDVSKNLGPLHIGRVGHALTGSAPGAKVLDLALDASIEVAGLTVATSGLGVRYEFATRQVTPYLHGLGIDLRRGPLAVGGAFLNADGDFLGQVLLATPKFSINAIGGFMMLDGTPSMFAYAVLDVPLGGPVFFFVEGLAAGFGLHRRLHMPAIDAVRTFPLIASAGVKPAGKVVPRDEQFKLHDYIAPALGEYFLALGLKFNSFRLLHGCAVLVVSAGENFELDLIGTADFVSPPDLPPTAPALARIRLDLLARYAPAEGLIAVEARVDPASYVYGPLCHLSGGFAFYAWTDGLNRGDFVLSVGGYYTTYPRPAHYPVVPRVELSYQVTPEVYLKGDAYFALTPSIMMAGGGLHAQLNDGSLHAWADFTVDFLVSWEPFHYDAQFRMGIGASWKCFSTSASAVLHLWGPDFSGTAHVDWWAFSFDFAFGPQSPVVPRPISMAKFKHSFLGVDATQKSQDALVGILVTGGMVAQVGGISVVEPAGVVIATSSHVPATSAWLGSTSVGVGKPALGVAPAGVGTLEVSEHTVTITRAGDPATGGPAAVPVDVEFTATKIQTAFPAALWAPLIPPLGPETLPIVAATGIELRPATPVKPGLGRDQQVSDLDYDQTIIAMQRVLTAHRRLKPVVEPTTLPVADLSALGLNASALVWVPHPAGRARLDMLTGEMEATHG